MLSLPKYSLGVGDRFAHQGEAQLDAILLARGRGVEIAPVWNKSHREHSIIGSRPEDVRAEADNAVRVRGWTGAYFVDADHINLKTVDLFLNDCDFFTLDVADWIGVEAEPDEIADYVDRHRRLAGRFSVPGIDRPLEISMSMITDAAKTYLAAIREAGGVYRRIAEAKGKPLPVIEVSMDETDRPQTPTELLLILAAAADVGIPVQTIAPRFVGRFNKGVEYAGDVTEFRRQFEADLAVVAYAVRQFDLPENLKLSVHSGSDKFALYGPMHESLRKFNAGVHLKTAGTTWLEELIGLAAAGGDGLQIAKRVYSDAWRRYDELCAPYASVLDVDAALLPPPETVAKWAGGPFAAALRHDAACPSYNPHLRQLLHVAYKVAAEMAEGYTDALKRHADKIAANVTANLYQRHIVPLFLGQ